MLQLDLIFLMIPYIKNMEQENLRMLLPQNRLKDYLALQDLQKEKLSGLQMAKSRKMLFLYNVLAAEMQKKEFLIAQESAACILPGKLLC